MNIYKKSLLSLGIVLVLVGASIFVINKYLSSQNRSTPIVYADNAMLLELWNNYKTSNIEKGSNRTLDKTQANITTSEAESYTMLRAVWMDDKTTFDNSWLFTKNNMQRSADHLLSWKFGKRNDGSYGLMVDSGGVNTASDADIDTALSLVMAYSRWNDPSYLYQAKQMINSIWNQEVVLVDGKPVLVANNIEKNSPYSVVVNPSYFSTYSFKIFGKTDPNHNWKGLVDNSYALLDSLSKDNLGLTSSSNLPPDWVKLNRVNGTIIPNATANLDTNYGYDAMRIPFRLALDYQWFNDPRDVQILEQFKFLGDSWKLNKSLDAVYGHDGKIIDNYQTPAMYGGAIGYFNIADTQAASEVYKQKLETLYSPDRQQWKSNLSYYDDNWAWFGIALTQHYLPNLALINN